MSVRKATPKQKQRDCPEKENVQTIIHNIKNYWPDFVIHEQDLRNPEPSFVFKFYSRFYEEYEKTLQNIRTNSLKIIDDAQVAIDPCFNLDEIGLAVKLSQISKQIDMNCFFLNDICEPQPKRTVIFFILFMNLLIYATSDQETIDEISEIAEINYKFQEDYSKKQQLLHEIRELNLLHFKLDEDIKKLISIKENVSIEHKKVLAQKPDREFEYQKSFKHISRLKTNIQLAEETLVHLREESNLLQEQIVDQKNVEDMKNKISALKEELEILDIDYSSRVSGFEEQEAGIKHYKKCLEMIKTSDLEIETLSNFEKLIDSKVSTDQELKNIEEETKNLMREICTRNKEIGELHKSIIKLEEEVLNLKHTFDENFQNVKRNFKELCGKEEQKTIQSKLHEEEISEIVNMISEVKGEMTLLSRGVTEEYSKLIEKQAAIYNRFNNALINIDNYHSSCE